MESSGEVLCVGCEDPAGCLDPWRSIGVVYGLVKGGRGGGRGVVRFVWTLRRGLLLRNLEGLCVWCASPRVSPNLPLLHPPSPARLVPPSLFLLVLVYLVSSPPFAPPLRTHVVSRVTYRPAALLMNSRAFQQSREDGSGDAATGAVAPGRGLCR